MKKFYLVCFLVAILIFVFVVFLTNEQREINGIDDVSLVVIDGCEYFSCPVYCGYVLVHKANCKNHE